MSKDNVKYVVYDYEERDFYEFKTEKELLDTIEEIVSYYDELTNENIKNIKKNLAIFKVKEKVDFEIKPMTIKLKK